MWPPLPPPAPSWSRVTTPSSTPSPPRMSMPLWDDEAKSPSVQVQFRYGPYSLMGTGRMAHRVHPHVYHLEIRRDIFTRFMHWLVALCLPRSLHTLPFLPPLWCLPPNIVLKTLKPDWDDEFAKEIRMYECLKPLQGSVIPIFYGQATCDDGTPAFVLSDVGGLGLGEDEVLEMDEPELRRMVEQSLNAMIALGFDHDDVKLDNFRLVGDRVVILDLELVHALTHAPEEACRVAADDLMYSWARYRRNKWNNS